MPRAKTNTQTENVTSTAAENPAIPTAVPKIDVRITSMYNRHENPLRALTTVVIDDCFAVKGVRVLRGQSGLYVTMPARRGKDGVYREVCNPITKDFARNLSATVLNEYQVQLAIQMAESEEVPRLTEPEAEMEADGEQTEDESDPVRTPEHDTEQDYQPEMAI